MVAHTNHHVKPPHFRPPLGAAYSRRRGGPGRGPFPPRVPDIGLFPGGGLWAHPGRTNGRERESV